MFATTISNVFPFTLSIALKSTVILAAAWGTALLMRKASAAARHLLWTSAWAALLLLPLLSLSMPALHFPLGEAVLPAFSFHAESTADASTRAASSRTVVRPAGTAPTATPFNWRLGLLMLWTAGTVVTLARTSLAYLSIARQRSRARALLLPGVPAHVEVLETEPGSMPQAFGLLRPTVLLPEDAAQWTEERRRVVLLHELAHVRRGDVLTHLLARIALSLHWWNPLAWTAWHALLREREHATDDLVLRAGTRASEYAGHLLDIARQMQQRPATECAGVAMARRSHLEGRLAAILDPGVNRAPLGSAAAALVMLTALAVAIPVAALKAQEPAAQKIPADVNAAIQSATTEKNFQTLDAIAARAVMERKYDIARQLLDASLSIRAAVSGTGSVDYGTGLLHLGDLLRRSGSTPESDDFYNRAISILGERPEAAAAYVHLGTSAIVNKNLDLAMQDLEQARIADPAHAAPALMWMAVVREKQQNLEEAETLFRQAISMAPSNTPEAATAMELFAQLLKDEARPSEAQPLLDIAAATRKAASSARFKDGRITGDALKIGNGVSAPSVITKIEPEYTDEARVAKYQGTVVLGVAIGTDGVIYQANVLKSLGLGLDEKAVDAVTQWKFKPGTRDGQPVNVFATIEVNFRLL